MPDLFDVRAFARLDRKIKHRLWGDEKTPGHYRSLYLGGNWETVCHIRGIIFAYEEVIKMMHEVAKEMNNEDRQAEQPPRMN